MSLFEELGKKLLGSVLSGKSDTGGSFLDGIMQLIREAGGIQAILQRFQQAGFGAEVASWLGKGENLPINAIQVEQVLGGSLAQLAQRTGLSETMLADGMAKILPGLVDKISPDGQVSDEQNLPDQLQALVSGGLGKLFS